MPELMELLNLIGGQSTPPSFGGPTPPQGMPYPLGTQGGNSHSMAGLAGVGLVQLLGELRKYEKAKNSVGMQLDKPTQVSPFAPGIGPADLQARASRMAGQQSPPGPPGAMPGGPPPGMPPGMPGGMPPSGAPPGAGGLLAMLAARGRPGGM